MLTAEEARGLSEASPWLARFEGSIRDAARGGRRCAMLTFCDCGEEAKRAMGELQGAGFRIVAMSAPTNGEGAPAYWARW